MKNMGWQKTGRLCERVDGVDRVDKVDEGDGVKRGDGGSTDTDKG